MKANIGIRAHDMEKMSLQQLPKAIAEKGLSSVQLAIAKSFPELYPEPGALTPGLAHHLKQSFAQHNIKIAVLGCYINMIHPDKNERTKQLEKFKEHLRYARDLGCSIVGTETGSVIPELGYTEDNFGEAPYEEVVESVRELVAEAEKFGVIVGIEGGINHPIHTPQRMKRLLDDISSNHLQVIYDPANFISPENFTEQEKVIDEAMSLFGDRIVVLHAKDFVVEDGQIVMVPVGSGLLNYDAVFRQLKKRKPYINILMESTKEPHITNSIAFLQEKYELA
ncbi:sugar phosphate isomerase/epimerase family protein [Ureibacillus sinduriensis]|uniref:AP endonuclease n=1 Tax=Ureibacillus sinduriensis BLB-1 = JCM 15800 TaxID=1384057 RepID=A0A0A3HRF8_9BACL|nr:sugar phosphate isomerase/epimerase family protein [Ureibacillus sinduriensis]KGR75196.1 AP endonuclease [Ureibacillus sinduriensis BLB-1 = JCM 15800]